MVYFLKTKTMWDLDLVDLTPYKEELEEEYDRILSSSYTTLSHSGGARDVSLRKHHIDLGKKAEVIFRTKVRPKEPLQRISPENLKPFPKLYSNLAKKNWIYHDLINLKTGSIFEIKIWKEEYCRTDSSGYKSFKRSLGEWNFSNHLVVFAYKENKCWIKFVENLDI